MFVSSRRLPLIRVHPLAPLLDGLDHLARGFRVQGARESPEVSAWYTPRSLRGKAMNEFSGACLLLWRKSIQIVEDLFLDRGVHHRHLLGFASRNLASVPLQPSRRFSTRRAPKDQA